MSQPSAKPPLPFLAITMGDPAGIGPEIIVKALAKPKIWRVCRPLVVGSLPVMERTARALGFTGNIVPIHRHQETIDPHPPFPPWPSAPKFAFRRGCLPVFDPFDTPLGRFPQGRPGAISGSASVQCIQIAVRMAQNGYVGGIVTAPINKKAIHLAGSSYPGHTELLADLTRTKAVGMMILGGPLKILFVTTHVALRDLPVAITLGKVVQAIRLAHQGLHKVFGIAQPRIGVAGLNPHAGEEGLFGQEERQTIAPAVRQARSSGIHCSGPHPADTLFGKAVRGEYDGIVAMYHDQGLVALKTVAFGHCVNLTVGLPIIRTSVDHGTAYDIVGKGIAEPTSLIEAILLAAKLAPSK